MVISYNNLWTLLAKRELKKTDLKKLTGIGSSTLAKLGQNQPVALEVLLRICSALGCDIGDVMEFCPDTPSIHYKEYTNILREELIPSLGCTEPSALAFVAAKVRSILGAIPDKCIITISGPMLKNARSVIVPKTNGRKGIRTAVAAGFIGGNPDGDLEVLASFKESDIPELEEYIVKHPMDVVIQERTNPLFISIKGFAGDDVATVTVDNGHLDVRYIEKNGEILFNAQVPREVAEHLDYSLLNVEEIVEYASNVKLEEVEAILERQVSCNMALSAEGMRGTWGANIGQNLLNTFGDSPLIRSAAAAAAGCDARMSGCELPAIILSGSGNQGITSSAPVIEYARIMGCSREKMLRALLVSDLVAIHIKTGIGKLSAYCGVVCAGCGAACGIVYLKDLGYDAIAHTIVNCLATVSGIVCDGAKPSCASKSAISVLAGLLGSNMYTEKGSEFTAGDGIVVQGVENNIDNVGKIASIGMREVDKEILRIMSDDC